MIVACRQFLTARLGELILPTSTTPYRPADPDVPGDPGTVFFGELPRDFLKDHDCAAQCLALQDRSQRYGKLISQGRDLATKVLKFTRRRYKREILFRCFLYAPRYEDLWGENGYTGMVEQLQNGIAGYRVIADEAGNCIRIDPQENSRPWDSGVELERKLRRPHLAIVRVVFSGGIDTAETIPLIPDVTINPHIQ